MKSFLQDQRRSSLVSAGITALLGLILLIWPEWALRWLCILLGAGLAVTGAIYLLAFFQRRRQGFSLYGSLVLGIVLAALGVWLLTNPDGLLRLVQYIFGALLIFHGVIDLQGALSLMSCSRGPDRWAALAFSALTLGLGALIVLNPFGALSAAVMLIGAGLLFDGLSDFWLIYRLSRFARQAQDEARQLFQDDVIETKGRDLDE